MKRHGTIVRMLSALVLIVGGADSVAAAEQSLTPAQTALFDSDHFRNVTHPVLLDYAFDHRGGMDGDYRDKITADIRDVRADGRKDVWVEFLSGSHQIKFPPAMGFKGNPLLMYFLEQDVLEMHKATGGAALYFRNRIRQAFLDADMRPVKITLAGKETNATAIVIAPFRDDPNAARFPGFTDKTYKFVLSDAVPGTIYQISTTVPAAGPGAAGVFEESMTYAGERDEKP